LAVLSEQQRESFDKLVHSTISWYANITVGGLLD
jgi:hypothetical protein